MITNDSHEPRLGFPSGKIICHIEANSGLLADGLWARVGRCERLRLFRERVPQEELRQRVFEIYDNLGEWLQSRSEGDIERHYIPIGERRASQGVPLSQLILAIVATKEHLWEHVTEEVLPDHALDLFHVLELSRSIETFFDRAVYFATLGYERHQSARQRAAATGA
jgi:hypothetical protein